MDKQIYTITLKDEAAVISVIVEYVNQELCVVEAEAEYQINDWLMWAFLTAISTNCNGAFFIILQLATGRFLQIGKRIKSWDLIWIWIIDIDVNLLFVGEAALRHKIEN